MESSGTAMQKSNDAAYPMHQEEKETTHKKTPKKPKVTKDRNFIKQMFSLSSPAVMTKIHAVSLKLYVAGVASIHKWTIIVQT